MEIREEIRAMQMEDIEARVAELKDMVSAEDTDLEALSAELDELEARKAELVEMAEKRAAIVDKVAGMTPAPVVTERKEEKNMVEFRNSKEGIDAFERFIKSEGKDLEARSLLTTNAAEDGTVAVPDFVYDIIKTAWDENDIMSLVTKTSLKGNLKVQFEISGTDAEVHDEGDEAIDEETLSLGIVTIIPANIKKFIGISDEVMSLRGEAFLRYIYNELAYRIVKKAADITVAAIAALPGTATSSSPAAATIQAEPGIDTVAQAIANLSDEASNPVIIMNKLTWAVFKKVQYDNNYAVDPFEGLAVKFNSKLPAWGAADEEDVYMIVGDLKQGVIANFPDGDGITFKFDDLTRKAEDIVEVLGKQYVGIGVVANKAFTLIAKPEEPEPEPEDGED